MTAADDLYTALGKGVAHARLRQHHIDTHRAEVLAEADPWPVIDRLVAWLDQNNGRSHNEITLRLLKISEEAGEVAQAWIGYTGQNPRKGVTHSAGDVADELCDVIVTAMVALGCVTDHPARHFAGKLAEIAAKRGAGSKDGTRTVAYRSRTSNRLYCRLCCTRLGVWADLTSEDLPDGGICASCGRDVLIDPPQPEAGEAL